MNVKIDKFGGEIDLESPSLATCFEFVALWTSESDNAQLARLCSGALGVCLDHTRKLPKYRPGRHSPREYGHKCLERLLEYGITASIIYEQGVTALSYMATKIPTEKEVEEKANFSSSLEPDTSIGSS
tara:strand:- start:427 stop:810 length:384 start_codon:yes stop_codon:yes gene_type:complete